MSFPKEIESYRSINICVERQQLENCLKENWDRMAVSAHLVRQMNVGFQEIFTWRGPSAPSPHIDAEGKFVSARTIRSPWPWCNTLVMEEHVWSGKLEMLQKNVRFHNL